MTTAKTDTSANRQTVQSVHRASAILDLLGLEDGRAQTALEIARATGLDRTVVHRLLRTLSAEGLVGEVDAGRYTLGSRIVELAHSYLDGIGIQQAALPYATEFHASIKGRPWCVSLAVPTHNAAVLIDRLFVIPDVPIDTILELGTRLPVHQSAIGRALLAYGGDGHGGPDWEPVPELEERLEAIRAAGGVECSEGLQPGISAVAAVIFTRRRRAVGAIAVSGPELEDQLSRDSEVAVALRRTADRIGRILP